MPDYSKLNLPECHIDEAWLEEASTKPDSSKEPLESSLPWIFIIGLHRSGTTYLQQTLVEYFNLVSPTIYHILYFEALIHNAQNGLESQQKARLADFFKDQGLHDRLIDHIPLTPNTCEEIGFLLGRLSGSLTTNRKNVHILIQLGQKLSYLHSGSQGLLIKNPWDVHVAPQLVDWFPNARFIFLRRSKQSILRSQLSNAAHYGSEADPYLDLLIKDIPLLKITFSMQRQLYRITTRNLYHKLFRFLLDKDIDKEIRHYENAYREIDQRRCIEINYEELINEPQIVFSELKSFLQMDTVKSLDSITPQPRETKNQLPFSPPMNKKRGLK